MKTICVAILIIAAMIAVGSSDSGAQVYCGRRLALALAYLCDYGQEEQLLLSKKSVNSIRGSEGWFWLYPKSMALGVRGKRQGVASECCDKPCELSELLSYC